MDKTLKKIYKTMQSKIYRAETSDELKHIDYMITILQLATDIAQKEFLNLLLKLRRQLVIKTQILEAI